ncbi:MAG: hypothetical protein ACR65Z_07045 [Methylocystis sp.]
MPVTRRPRKIMMFWRCLRVGYTARARTLIERHGAEWAYSRCRLRAAECQAQGDAAAARQWQRLGLRVAELTNRESRPDTATRMAERDR